MIMVAFLGTGVCDGEGVETVKSTSASISSTYKVLAMAPQTAIYTVDSTSAVTTTGVAPSGSSAVYSQSFVTSGQITKDNFASLSLSGYAGFRVTSIVLSMKSNNSSGAGTLSIVTGSTTIASVSPSANFNSASWFRAWSTSYVDISKTPTSYDVGVGENVVITIGATVNSLYIESYSITYEPSIASSEINVLGNSTNIISGATTTSISNHTNFSTAEVSVGSQLRTFTIENTGTLDLNLTAATPITISGANASDFSLTVPPTTPIAAGSNSPFQITFSPTALGIRNAVITIANDDSDENPYTFAISGTSTYSNKSQILDVTNYASNSPEFNINPEYINYIDPSSTITGKFIPMKLRIIDGPDSDVLPTILTDLRILVTDLTAANQLSMIKTAILTTTGGTLISTATKVGNELVFSGMSGANVAADDDGQQNIHLRISIDENQVVDQTKLVFLVTSAFSSSAGSAFALPNAGGAQTDASNSNNRNRLNVTASKLLFDQQPQTTAINSTMSVVVVEAVDSNNKRDINYATAASLTSSGTMSGTPLTANFTSGLATFSSIVHTVAGNGLTLTANSSSFSAAISSAFNITEIIYLSGDYRTTASGKWISNRPTPAIWERYNGTVWLTSNSPLLNTTDNVYIRNNHTITTETAFNGVNLKIMDGGFFWIKSISSITSSIYIYEGGKLRTELAFQNNGLFEVENNAIVELYYKVSYSSTIWNGTERFHPKSNLVLIEMNADTPFFNGIKVTQNMFNGYTAAFGNIIIDVVATADATLLNPGLNANLAHGDLIFRKFPFTKFLRLSNGGNITTEIGGNFIVESGFIDNINSCTNGTLKFGIKGNMILKDGETRISTLSTSNTSTFTVDGDIDMTGPAILNLNATSAGLAFSTLNLKGNLNCTSTATIKSANTSPNDNINFIGSSLQTINVATNLATCNSNIIYNVDFGSNVKIIHQDLRLGTNGVFNVLNGGTLDFGFNGTNALNISRAGAATGTKFSSDQGSTLKITSPDGISTTAGTSGNVQTTIAPNYNSLAAFWYQGKANQATGTGLPIATSGKIVYVDLFSNTYTLTPTASVGISNATTLDPLGGKLEILKGVVIGSNTADFFGGGRLKMSDGEYKISSYYSSNPETTYLPRLSNYGNYDLSGGVIHLLANNQTQILSGTPNYFSLKFSGSNTLGSNYKGISTATAVVNSILLSESAIVDVKSSSFGMLPQAPTFTMTDNSRFITAGTGVKPDATGTYSLDQNTTIEFSSNAMGTIQRPRLTNPIPSYANIVVSGSNVGNISAGGGSNSNIKFQPFGSFRVTKSGTFKLFNNFGFNGNANTAISSINNPAIILDSLSTIEYSGTDQIISSLSPSFYANLTISGSGQKILGNPSNIFVNENLQLNSANLLVNTNEVITVRDAVISTSGTMQIENNGQLIQINNLATNIGTGLTYKRTSQAKNLDYIYWSSPVDNFETLSLPGNNHHQWNTLFDNSNGTQGNWEVPTGTPSIMTVGRGYIARASNGAVTPQALISEFVGKPNNGSILIPVFRGDYMDDPYDAEPTNPNNLDTTKDDDNWNLIGNPYPSAIDAIKFLTQNQFVIDGAVHIWRHESLPTSTQDPYYADFAYNYHASDYTIYNKLGTSIPNTFNGKIAAGQGFMVTMSDAVASGTPAVFNNAMRYNGAFIPYNNSNFYRSQSPIESEDKSRIWLDLVNTTTEEVGTILVGYAEDATIDKDHFYDCGFESRGDHSFYSIIDSESFVIQGRPLPFNMDDIVPLGLTLNHFGNLAISIREVDGLFASDTPIFIEDRQLNVFHDLKLAPYFFTSEIGRFDDRFQLRYGTALSIQDSEFSTNDIQIIKREGIIYLKSKNLSIDEVAIFDMLGRLLLKSEAQNQIYLEIPLNILANQVIIVKAKLENGQTVSQKIIF